MNDSNAFIIYAAQLLHSLCLMSSEIGVTDCANQFQHFTLLIQFQTNIWNENWYELLECIKEFLHTFCYLMSMILLGMCVFLMKHNITFEGKHKNKLCNIGTTSRNFGFINYNSRCIFTRWLRSTFIMFAS